MTTYLLFPPAITHSPSVREIRECFTRSIICRRYAVVSPSSPETSLRPSITPVCLPCSTSQKATCPSSVDAANSWPSGRNASASTSALSVNGSTASSVLPVGENASPPVCSCSDPAA
ncbi:hypothetical protein JB92DRAFT_2988585 [Gautieria morchelliformis]|nr:hypothetical protein JB92DRAFT_2988585 [Gautieria morchelliformis]